MNAFLGSNKSKFVKNLRFAKCTINLKLLKSKIMFTYCTLSYVVICIRIGWLETRQSIFLSTSYE